MDRCDRCGGAPSVRYDRHQRRLILCATHAKIHGRALILNGWRAHHPAPAAEA